MAAREVRNNLRRGCPPEESAGRGGPGKWLAVDTPAEGGGWAVIDAKAVETM